MDERTIRPTPRNRPGSCSIENNCRDLIQEIFMLRSSLSALVLLAGITTVVMADDRNAPVPEQPAFQAVDRNGDHRISRTEAGTYKSLIDRFAYLDTDADGFISEPEFAAAHATLNPTS
jgi:hypothetical protein